MDLEETLTAAENAANPGKPLSGDLLSGDDSGPYGSQ